MDIVLIGGGLRTVQGLAAAAPTLIVGLFTTSVLRYYLGPQGTQRLFGGNSLWALPQAWAVGMLLPVCSIGVIPIIREMRRVGIRPGAITAFALSAPLFNPLSLLYGLTLSRPLVIIGFATGSLVVVTVLGIIWDRNTSWRSRQRPAGTQLIGMRRLGACGLLMVRELAGPTGLLTLLAVIGLFLLGASLPHGALQSSVEQDDILAPLKMAAVAIPIYATPMLTMSQLGMMFSHGNSPGAAFCLLLLGTGVNLATLYWIYRNFGGKATLIFFSVLVVIVLGCAYAIDRPLIPPGIEPAGHTHAFDIYTNPLQQGSALTADKLWHVLTELFKWTDLLGLAALVILGLAGAITRVGFAKQTRAFLEFVPQSQTPVPANGLNRHVSPRTVGLTCLGGLVALSVVACYAYYPKPSEVLEEMRLARVELLSAAASGDLDGVLHWIPVLEEWSRKLEVGNAIRHFELRPYQRMQAHLLREKLELLEHTTEHAKQASENPEIDLETELAEIKELREQISATSRRLTTAFQSGR